MEAVGKINIILAALAEKIVLIARTVKRSVPCSVAVGRGKEFKYINFRRPAVAPGKPKGVPIAYRAGGLFEAAFNKALSVIYLILYADNADAPLPRRPALSVAPVVIYAGFTGLIFWPACVLGCLKQQLTVFNLNVSDVNQGREII